MHGRNIRVFIMPNSLGPNSGMEIRVFGYDDRSDRFSGTSAFMEKQKNP
jgi:hypothetical protein